MQSKTVNIAVLLLPIVLMNAFVAFIRPVNVLGILVMNAVYFTVLLAVQPLLKKYTNRQRS